jgi:hypothetical protein
MSAILFFWLPALVILAVFEALLFKPAWLWYYLILLILAGSTLSWQLARQEIKRTRLSFLALFLTTTIGAFFWLLWIDFAWFKFLLPPLMLAIVSWLALPGQQYGKVSSATFLSLFLAGTFFWSTVSFGLLTVLGWPLSHAVLVFLVAFILLAQGANFSERRDWPGTYLASILLILLGMEIWSVIVWLPFSEMSLGLLTTLAVLLIYDLLKYFIDPALIRRRIVWRKLVIYFIFTLVILLLLRWQ